MEKSPLAWQKVYLRRLWRLWLISAILITSFIYINTWKRKIMAGIWKRFQTVAAAEWKRIGKMKESGLIAQTKVDNRRPNDLNKWWTTNHKLIPIQIIVFNWRNKQNRKMISGEVGTLWQMKTITKLALTLFFCKFVPRDFHPILPYQLIAICATSVSDGSLPLVMHNNKQSSYRR